MTLTVGDLSAAGAAAPEFPNILAGKGAVPGSTTPTLSSINPTPTPATAISVTMVHPSTFLSRKCPATEPEQLESVKRSKGWKHSAIDSMALSMDCLATAFANDSPVPSPEWKCQAIKVIEEDDDLSETECLHAYQIIRRDTTFADTVLSIGKKERHTHYIQCELDGDDWLLHIPYTIH